MRQLDHTGTCCAELQCDRSSHSSTMRHLLPRQRDSTFSFLAWASTTEKYEPPLRSANCVTEKQEPSGASKCLYMHMANFCCFLNAMQIPWTIENPTNSHVIFYILSLMCLRWKAVQGHQLFDESSCLFDFLQRMRGLPQPFTVGI
jgi:hypothetical protein